MSTTSITTRTQIGLWVKASGRCEYEGCNQPLWRDDLTMAQMNRAYLAHIIADSPGGPRGDPVLSPQLATELSNLMLLCDGHHRLVDREQLAEHPVARLRHMKELHESRIEELTNIRPEKRSEVLLYGANIGAHNSPVSFRKAAQAMVPERYPASRGGIALGMVNSAFRDRDEVFWRIESENLRRLFAERVAPRLIENPGEHLSVFAVAPQPLLMLLGFLLSDIPATEVHQLHREPQDWRWQNRPDGFAYRVEEPPDALGEIALVLALSAPITRDRISRVLGDSFSMWVVTIDEPHNDFLRSRRQLQQFRATIRPLLDRIKARHRGKRYIHVFPAVPVAAAVEFGRIVMPKASLPLRIYDENASLGGFVHALDLAECEAR